VSTELAIRNLDDLDRLSKTLAISNLLPVPLRGKPADVQVILLYGTELGLRPMQALQGIYVVEGRPSLAAQLWIAKARERGHQVYVPCKTCGRPPQEHPEPAGHNYVSSHTDTECTVRAIRGDTGEAHQSTYKLDDAIRAGKVRIHEGRVLARSAQGKPLPWETSTKAMLLARAASATLRFLCPEVAFGFYAEGELDEPETVVVEAERIDVPAEPAADPEPVDITELAEVVAEYEGGTP